MTGDGPDTFDRPPGVAVAPNAPAEAALPYHYLRNYTVITYKNINFRLIYDIDPAQIEERRRGL